MTVYAAAQSMVTHVFCGGQRVHGLRPRAGLLAHLRELKHAALRQRVVGLHALQQALGALVQAELQKSTRRVMGSYA